MSAYIGFARQKEYCDVQFCLDDPGVEVMSDKLAEISGAQMTPRNWAVLLSFKAAVEIYGADTAVTGGHPAFAGLKEVPLAISAAF